MSFFIDKLPQLLVGAKEFTEECGLDFNAENAASTLMDYDASPYADVLMVEDGEMVHAAALVSFEEMFQHQRIGTIVKLYVRKHARCSGVSRELMSRCVTWFDLQQCVYSFAFVTGGLPTDRLTLNLYKRFGYEGEGNILQRNYGR